MQSGSIFGLKPYVEVRYQAMWERFILYLIDTRYRITVNIFYNITVFFPDLVFSHILEWLFDTRSCYVRMVKHRQASLRQNFTE